MTTLYEISTQYQQAFYDLADSDLDDAAIDNTLEGLEGELAEKAQNITAFYLNLDAEIAAIKQAEQRISNRRKSLENKRDKLKEYLKINMAACGITEIKANDFSFVAKLYIGRDKSVEVVDESLLPAEFVVEQATRTPDKAAIKKAIESGGDVPGAVVVKKDRLEIK